MPPPLLAVARRAVGANLLLNLIISLHPQVDVAAHVGGGLGGAVACWLSMRSLPGTRGAPGIHGRARPATRALAVLLAGSYLVGCIRAQVAGRPWAIGDWSAASSVSLGSSGYRAELPDDLSESPEPLRPLGDDGHAYSFGNLAYDPVSVHIGIVPLRVTSADAPDPLRPSLELLVRQLAAPVPGRAVVLKPRVVQEGTRRSVFVRYRYTDRPDHVFDRSVSVDESHQLRVEVAIWSAFASRFDGLANRVMSSLVLHQGVSRWRALQPSGPLPGARTHASAPARGFLPFFLPSGEGRPRARRGSRGRRGLSSRGAARAPADA
jgi:hypothetical protein